MQTYPKHDKSLELKNELQDVYDLLDLFTSEIPEDYKYYDYRIYEAKRKLRIAMSFVCQKD
jgi:hypothetical protein